MSNCTIVATLVRNVALFARFHCLNLYEKGYLCRSHLSLNMKRVILPLVLLTAFLQFACQDDGTYNPPPYDGDDTTYTVTEASDGSIATGVSGSMPLFMREDASAHQLITGVSSQTGLYALSSIKRIDLSFLTGSWASQLEAIADTDDELYASLTFNQVTLPYRVGVRYKGTVLPGDTTKRSFFLSIDGVKKDQSLGGYYTLALNNADKDPSHIRDAVYRHCIQQYVPTPQVNFVNLRINGVDQGVYTNTEHLNATFIREWFLSTNGIRWRAEPKVTGEGTTAGLYGTGFSGLNYLGESATDYEPYYDLKNKPEDPQPINTIINVCRLLEQCGPDSLERKISAVLDLDRTLWYLACENIFTDEDSYVNKGGTDYYLYKDDETGRLTPLEYDGKDTFLDSAVEWDPFYHADDPNYPLLHKLLAVPAIRQRYLAHYRTILKEVYNPAFLHPVIDAYAALVDSAVKADPRRPVSYEAFTAAVASLKDHVTQRSTFLNAHDSINVNSLIISDVQWQVRGTSWATPSATDTVTVTARISGGGTTGVFLNAGTGMVGGFRRLQMFDDGLHGDLQAGDGLFTALINPQSAGLRVRFYIEAVRGNASRTRSYMPSGAEHAVYTYTVE